MTKERRSYGTYLKERRGRYLVQVAVPATLRPIIGKAVLERYLGTADARIARARAPAAVAELKDVIQRQGAPLKPSEISAHRGRASTVVWRSIGRLCRQLRRPGQARRHVAARLVELDRPRWPGDARDGGQPASRGEATEDYARKLIRDAGAPETPNGGAPGTDPGRTDGGGRDATAWRSPATPCRAAGPSLARWHADAPRSAGRMVARAQAASEDVE